MAILIVALIIVFAIPAAAATYTVTTTADSGAGSLRDAITYANASSDTTITFDIPNTDPGYASGYWTISPLSELPAISAYCATLDGGSQTANRGNTNPGGPEIRLLGTSGLAFRGLVVTGQVCAIQSIAVCGFPSGGIDITGSKAYTNKVKGCYIGIDPTGHSAAANGSYGIRLEQFSHNNTIGGPNASDRNVISGNTGSGLDLMTNAYGNFVYGNYIGTDAAGTVAVHNQSGVYVQSGAYSNTIGGTGTGAAGNLISGNSVNGVCISLNVTGMNTIKSNTIGTDASGTAAVPNQLGVSITGGAHYETVEANLISGNTQSGIAVSNQSWSITIKSNKVGTNALSTAAVPNGYSGVCLFDTSQATITGNTVSGNSQNGIVIYSSNNTVSGNKVGTTTDGTSAIPNAGSGIVLYANASYNTIGGHTTADRNAVSGNGGCGIELHGATDNTIIGNCIGVSFGGNISVGNQLQGVLLADGATRNYIGTAVSGDTNIISGNGDHGVQINRGSGTNYVQGNKIGTDLNGVQAAPNVGGGVQIGSGSYTGAESRSNVIGGTVAGAKNIISGNGSYGIEINGDKPVTDTLIQGNYIGIDASGGLALGNTAGGVCVRGNSSSNTIGGAPNAKNVISGNGGPGILISGTGAVNNSVHSNFIGATAAGSAVVPNSVNGVVVEAGASNNIIGMTGGAGGDNSICGHSGSGVLIKGSGTSHNTVGDNCIGTSTSGTTLPDLHNGTGVTIQEGASDNAVVTNTVVFNPNGIRLNDSGTVHNRMLSNKIYNCSAAGITLAGAKTMYGMTCVYQNSSQVPNYGQTYPSLTSVKDARGGIDVFGFLNSTPGKTCTIEIFLSRQKNASGYGDGELRAGSVTVDTGATGVVSFYQWVPASLAGWAYVTATATDQGGNTSEFSNAIAKTTSVVILTMSVNDPTKGSVTPATGLYAYIKGTSQSISGMGLPGYVFDHWGGAVQSPTASDTSVLMDKSKTVIGHFISSVAATKKLPNNQNVTISHAVVTAVLWDYYMYLEAPDRSSGIFAYKGLRDAQPGTVVDVSGTLSTYANGERYINVNSITPFGTGSVKPIMLSNKCMGGGPWLYNASTGAGQKGVRLRTGQYSGELNNVGLLIRTTGKVTYCSAANGYYYIDDGSRLQDGWGRTGLYVMGDIPAPTPRPDGWDPTGHHVIVTGISSVIATPKPGADIAPCLYALDCVLVD